MTEKLQQAVGELDFPEIFAFVPWGHHIEIITKCKSIDEALFYIKKTIQEGNIYPLRIFRRMAARLICRTT